MKKNTVKMFIAGLMLAGALTANAQTAEQRKQITKEYDQAALSKLSQELAVEAKKNKEEALAMAAIKGWPVKFVTKEGNNAELMGIHENGEPWYLQTYNVNAAFSSGISSLNTDGSLGLNINGQNMLAALWDEERPRNEHITFGGRLTPVDIATEISMHPTHVMGTIMGSGQGSVATARGMAYESIGIAYDWNNDASEMTLEAGAGLLVSNHSYGSRASQLSLWQFGAYDSRARSYDQIAFNAKYYLIVKAAGNDRGSIYNSSKGGYDLINGTATAKNVLTVAAVNGLGAVYSNPDQVVMSDFSSWGPTDDNRVKPDISAKGVNVWSSVTSGNSNSTYGFSSGTSMASPVVSGAALLLQQLYNQQNSVYMRSATLRGLICHTADEAGPSDGPDAMFGWGLLDAKKAAQAILNNGQTSIIQERSLANNATYSVPVNAIGGMMQVSITWTDPAGAANSGSNDSTTPRLVNDLDIRVTQVGSGNISLPWRLASSNESGAEHGDNNVDNIERIDVPNANGQYIITVSHKNNITSGPQQYSLIVTGASAVQGLEEGRLDLFSMWPNPANSLLNIDLTEGAYDNASVSFYDVQGRVVLASVLTQTQNAIDTQNLSSGIYMVKVTQGGKDQVKKIVINK